MVIALSEEIAYLVGHKIETEGFKRNMFSNEDQLAIISSKLNMRPFFGSNDDAKPIENLSANNQLIELNNVWGTIITADSKVDATVSVRVSLMRSKIAWVPTWRRKPATYHRLRVFLLLLRHIYFCDRQIFFFCFFQISKRMLKCFF